MSSTKPAPTQTDLRRRTLLLEYGTMGWNVGEALLTITLGSFAGSLALIGFGTVSVVELFASGVVIWHVRSDDGEQVGRTRSALRLISVAFAVLAIALLIAASNDLITGRRAGESIWGIVYLAVTAVVMFILAVFKHRTAAQLGSEPLASEASMTLLDGVLSVTTLMGLALNAAVGWWWADPAAAVMVALAAFNESRENWSESSEVGADPLL